MADLPAALFRAWLHSHEEDTEETIVYRPAEHDFPPARGRRGFEFLPDGGYVEFGIHPADGRIERPGRWEAEGPDRVRVSVTETGESRTLEIAHVDERVLRVTRR